MKNEREIYRAAEKRWLAEPSGTYAGLHGILVAVIADKHPELLLEAAAHADEFVSVDQIVEKSLGVEA